MNIAIELYNETGGTHIHPLVMKYPEKRVV